MLAVPALFEGGHNEPRYQVRPLLRAGNSIDCFMPSASEHDNFSIRHNLRRRLKNHTVNNQPATINATAIDWQLIPGPANDTGVVSYHTDCTTGILTENFTYHL